MTVTTVSIVLAAMSVVAASVFYSFQIWNQTRLRKTDLLLRLYGTFDTLEFQEAFHNLYWAEFHDYDTFLEHVDGQRQIGTYVATFYDQVGALLRRKLIDYDLVDDLLGNSAIQLWEKFAPVVHEARERYDPRLYGHFEFLYDEMAQRTSAKGEAELEARRLLSRNRSPGTSKNGMLAADATRRRRRRY